MLKTVSIVISMIFLSTPGLNGQDVPSTPIQPDPAATEEVIINGITLSAQQIKEMEQAYGAKPLPGNYWYDTNSELYGVVGYPSYGFMLEGYDLGELQVDASNGDSPVFVNKRQLPQSEWLVWSYLLGYLIQPGRYWLDAIGKAGLEGNHMPMENLYLAAQRNNYNGAGS